MQQITNVIEFIKNIQITNIIDIIIALIIFLGFKLFSSTLSCTIIKLFTIKRKKLRDIKENPFYDSIKIFFSFLGLYIAILFLKTSLNIDDNIMLVITKIFKIVTIIAFAKGLANSITSKSNFTNKMKQKLNKNIDDSMFRYILKFIKIFIYVIAGFLIITELGYNLNGLVAGVGIGGVIITLAAQDTAKNLFGGLVIFIDKPFIVGDWIQMELYEGTVEDITFRSTRVRTFENSVVNIPNSIISNSSIINWSRMEKRRYKINLCLELDTPLEKVEKVRQEIYDMLQNHEDVIDESIIVKFDTITENGINILVYVYTNSVDYTSFITEKEKINYKIMQILNNDNINLAYNTQTIYLKK